MAKDELSKKSAEQKVDEVEAFLGETSVITVNNKKYKLKRLGITDVFKLGRILSKGAAGMGKEMGKLDLMDPGVFAALLLISFPYAEDECMEFIANVIGVNVQDLKNPILFPIDSILDIMKALLEHEDIKAFFIKLGGLLKTPIFKGFLKKD